MNVDERGDTEEVLMLWARSSALQELVERYEGLLSQAPDVRAEPAAQDLLRDTAYTLCVATGARDVESALTLARSRIAEDATNGEPGVEVTA